MLKVLMLHRILPAKRIAAPNAYATFGTLISQEYFEQVLTRIIDLGFTFINITEGIKQTKTDKLIALTFDDGYADNFEFALDSLHKFKATATFFPVVQPCRDNTILPLDTYYEWIDGTDTTEEKRRDFITGDTKKAFYWANAEQQYRFLKQNYLKRPNENTLSYLQPKQIKILADSGFEIGSHSMTHALFTANYMDDSKINFEMKQSKMYLETLTSKPVNSFCFPSGYYSNKMIEQAKELGYTSVCLIKKNKNEVIKTLPFFERFFVKPNALDELTTYLTI